MQQILLIRGLVLASLTLLVWGAVSPLLTTERFYFFSNTFTLVSGIRQLVINQQYVIAGIVGVFALCVPLIKAAVLWMAPSMHDPAAPLVVLADRFGKWSMLEVFIAALLIVALKLGPVADATLHYGAYLLAASVLVSGLASQLLSKTSDQRPLFSSPATLTCGALIGAASATLLIGSLHPDLLSLESLFGNAETRCVQRALRIDKAYADPGVPESEYLSRLRGIELNGCPVAFQAAFADYIESWERLEAQDRGDAAEAGLLHRLAARLGIAASRDEMLDDIEKARSAVERIALEHGVSAPAN